MHLLFHGIGLYLEGQSFGPVCWPHHDLLIVKEGRIFLETCHGGLHFQTGDAIWVPPNVRFSGLMEAERGNLWVIHFRSDQSKPETYVSIFEAGLGLLRGGIVSQLAIDLADRLHSLYEGDGQWPLLAEAYLSALLVEAARNARLRATPEEQWVHSIEQWADAHLSEGVGIKELACQAALSESHFRRLFLNRQGISAGRFLHDLRLKRAKVLLRSTFLSLKEISDQVGYSDPTAFHRAFSTHLKMTPSAFRKYGAGTV